MTALRITDIPIFAGNFLTSVFNYCMDYEIIVADIGCLRAAEILGRTPKSSVEKLTNTLK